MSEHRVLAQMNASVWKVEVDDGQAVNEGDTIVILESMKMEIPVEAPAAGTVGAVHVAEKDAVTEGDLIATITSD